MLLTGVDGCPGGWIGVTLDLESGSVRGDVYPDAAALFERHPGAIIAIDIPIGLPASGPRAVDCEARRLLGPRASSVFPAPVRAVVDATSYPEACAISLRVSGKSLSKQTYAILPKIRDVDRALRLGSASVYEVHPEVSFCTWNGGKPMAHPKMTGLGFLERLRLVEGSFGQVVERIRASLPRRAVSDDDILDALAGLWTARRIHDGCARSMAPAEERDECGLLMTIFA